MSDNCFWDNSRVQIAKSSLKKGNRIGLLNNNKGLGKGADILWWGGGSLAALAEISPHSSYLF